MDANVDQLFCVLDRPTTAGFSLEHEIPNWAEWRLLRDPGGRGPALTHRHLHFQKRKVEAESGMSGYSFRPRNRSAFAITETELKLMAAAAKTGCNSNPVNGY